jgi:ATP synthase protein I
MTAPPRSPNGRPRPITRTVSHDLGMAPPSPVAHLKVGLIASTGFLLPAVGIGAVFAGWKGAVAAVGATCVVALFFVISTVAVAAADAKDPALTLPVALTTYITKVVVLGLVGFPLAQGNASWHPVTGWTLLAATLWWTSVQAWWFWRTPRPYVVLSGVRRDDPPHRD